MVDQIISGAMNITIQTAVKNIATNIENSTSLSKTGSIVDGRILIDVLQVRGNINIRGNVNSSNDYACSTDTLRYINNRLMNEFNKINVPSLMVTIKTVNPAWVVDNSDDDTEYSSYEIPEYLNKELILFLISNYSAYFYRFGNSCSYKKGLKCKDSIIARTQVWVYFDAVLN